MRSNLLSSSRMGDGFSSSKRGGPVEWKIDSEGGNNNDDTQIGK